MKRIVLPTLLVTAFILGSCQTFRTPPVTQHWFLGEKDFAGRRNDMQMQISEAEMHGNKIRLFVHVTDSSHFYYRGIPANSFCNISVRQNGMNYPVQNFTATEYRQVNREPSAFALVLDYSGSMGSNKDFLYQITRGLIQNKREQDAYSIIRYADRTSVDVPLMPDKSSILSLFGPTPKYDIGEMTATWDGVADGVLTLENSPYTNRTLVVFTDGGENASKVTQSWAFWRAKTAGVKIVAISLGSAGVQNMQDLCEITGGMYTHINDINEMQNAYTDLVNKMSSFYLVEFETPVIGRQSVQVNLCNDMALYDTYTFDNSPPGPEPVQLKNPVPVTTTPVISNGGDGRNPVYTTPSGSGSSGSSSGTGNGRNPVYTPPGTTNTPTSGGSASTGGGRGTTPTTNSGTNIPVHTGTTGTGGGRGTPPPSSSGGGSQPTQHSGAPVSTGRTVGHTAAP